MSLTIPSFNSIRILMYILLVYYFTFAGALGLVLACFGGVVWVGFAGSAGLRGDFDDDLSSISCVDRPAAEIKSNCYFQRIYINPR